MLAGNYQMIQNPYSLFSSYLDKLTSTRREVDQTKILIKIQEDVMAQMTETIPQFNRFCGFLLNYLPECRSINAISVTAILQQILANFPGRYYYILKIIQISAAGLLSPAQEVKAAFMKFTAEMLASAETNPDILRAVRACVVPLVQGLVVSATQPADVTEQLLNPVQYQGVFLQILQRSDAFLRVLDDLLAPEAVFGALSALLGSGNRMAACALDRLQFYANKVQAIDRLVSGLVGLLGKDFEADQRSFYQCNLPLLILQTFETFNIRRAAQPLLRSYLQLARLRLSTRQFQERFDNVLNALEDEIRAELQDLDDADQLDCLLFAEYLDEILACGIVNSVILPYLMNFIYEQMLEAIKSRNKHLRSSQEYADQQKKVNVFKETVEKLMIREETKKIYHAPFQQLIADQTVFQFRDIDAERRDLQIQISAQEEEEIAQQSSDDCDIIEHNFELVEMVLRYFGIQFFPTKFYMVCFKSASQKGQITGSIIIMLALQEALVDVETVSHFKKYFVEHQLIKVIMENQDKQNELQRILMLRILHLLLERSFEMVSTDWFSKQREYYDFVQFLYKLSNGEEEHYCECYDSRALQFIESTKQVSFQNKSVDSFQLFVEDQALQLLSYLSNFINEGAFLAFAQNDLESFLVRLLTNCCSFSQAISFSSAIILGQLCYDGKIMEQCKAIIYDAQDEYEQVNLIIIQNVVSFIPAISIIHRMRSAQYKKLSQISAAPLVPLVNDESCMTGLRTVEDLKRCLLLNDFEQKEGLVKLQNLNVRFQKLNFAKDTKFETTRLGNKNKLQVDNIMMHPITEQFSDVAVLQPLQYLVNSTSFLKVICNQIIFEIVKLEPELLINEIDNFVKTAQRSPALQEVLAMPNLNMSMSDTSATFLQQKEATRLLKVVLGTNGFIIPELSYCVTEYVYQAIQKYTSLSSIDTKGQAMIMGLMDLMFNASLASLDESHENIIKLVTNFKYEQIQDIQQYIYFVSQRIQIIQSLNPLKQSQLQVDDQLYQYWLHALKLLLKYTKQEKKNDPQLPSFSSKINQFFSVFFKFNQLNLERIVEIFGIFLQGNNYRSKNVQLIYAMYLQNLNTIIGSKIKYREFLDGYSSKFEIFEGRLSVRLYATFLQICFLIELTYGQQFQDICQIFEDEMRDNPKLIYGIFQLIQLQRPLKGFLQVALDSNTEKPGFSSEYYRNISIATKNVIMINLQQFQPKFVQLIYSYNSSRALSDDPEQLFKESMERGILLMLLLLLNWKINQLDIGQRDAIVDLVGEQISLLQRDDIDKEQIFQQKQLIFRFLHELQLENQQINFSIINKYYISIKQIIIDLFRGLTEKRNEDTLLLLKNEVSETMKQQLEEEKSQKVSSLDVELAGEVVDNYKQFISCDMNCQEYDYDIEIYDIFKAYPYSFARCLFEMGRTTLVQDLFTELFSIYVEFQKYQKQEFKSDYDCINPTALALLDQIINIGRIPVDFFLQGESLQFLIEMIDANSQIIDVQQRFKTEILAENTTRGKIMFKNNSFTAPMMRRLLWVCAEINYIPTDFFDSLTCNFTTLISHSDKAYRFYQMQMKVMQEFVMPFSFRLQFLKKIISDNIQTFIQHFQNIIYLEFKMAIESAYYCARTKSSESRQTRMMAIPYLALQVMWPRDFTAETMKIALETWEIDPVAKNEQWLILWQHIEPEMWDCGARYFNARNYLLKMKFD